MPEGDSELEDLYREVLLDYSRDRARRGLIEAADFRSHGINPVCGDEIELTLRSQDGRVGALRYDGHGCVISQASAAMMGESLEGQTLPRARELAVAFKEMMLSRAPLDSLPAELETLKVLEGVRRFPLRVKCATLAWNTFLQGLTSKGAQAQYEETE